MFGIIFALIIALIVLAVVSYGAYKMYVTIQNLVQENETLKKDHARAAQAAIEYCTLAEDIRTDLRAKSFQMMDMEKALNVAIQESLDANGQIKIKGTTREFVDMVPTLKSAKEPELLIVGTMSNVAPVVKAEQIWMENIETGERSDITTRLEFPAVADEEKFDVDFWKSQNPPYPVVDTIAIDLSQDSLKAISEKIPGVEEIPEWEKELRKNPDLYEESSRPEPRKPEWESFIGSTDKAPVDQEKVTRILDGIFGPEKKTD